MIMMRRKILTDHLPGLLTSILLAVLWPTAGLAQHGDDPHGHSHTTATSHGGHGSSAHTGDAGTVHTLDEIVVTAEKLEEYIKNHPQNVVQIGADEIAKRNFLSVAETLGAMPGVDVNQRSSGLGTRISIRGSGGSGSVLVLVDGRPVNAGQYGGVDLETIPIDTIQKITVFKPPVPVWLGPGSTAGAVSIITKDADNMSASATAEARPKGRLKTSAGSFGTVDVSCSGTFPHENGGTMVSAGGGHSDGKRDNSDKDSVFFSLNWDTKDSGNIHYKIGGRYYYAKHGCPGPLYNLTPDADQSYDKGSLDVSVKGYTGPTGEFSLKAYGDFKDLEDHSQSGDKSMLEVYKTGVSGEHTWAEAVGLWAFRLGGKFEQDSVDHTGTGNIVGTGKHRRDKSSLHAQYDRTLGQLAFSIGLRGDHTSDFGDSPAGNLGASYGITDALIIKANAGYAENIPSFGQLYQPSHGSIDQAQGNPDLTEEKVVSWDLGGEYKYTQDLVVQASLFQTETRDLIVYERGIDLINRPINISKGTKKGVEVSCKCNCSQQFSIDFNYIRQETENHANDRELSYCPPHKGKLSLKYNAPFKTRVETIIRASSRYYSDIENNKDTEVAGYATVDLKVLQPVRVKSLEPELFVNFYNLLDKDYDIHYGYPDDGFRFLAGMNLNF